MTGDQLRTTVRELVGVDSSYARLSDTNINRAVDSAMHRLAVKAEPLALQAEFTASISASDATYELTSVALRIYSVHVTSQSRTLLPISYAELERDYPGWRDSTGTPTHYVIEGLNSSGYMKLRLWPTPAESTTNGLIVRFLAEPTSLASITSGEIVQWPEYVQDGFACYAAWRTIIRFSERGVGDPRAAAIQADWNDAAHLFVEQESMHPQNWGHCVLEAGAHQIGIELPPGWS